MGGRLTNSFVLERSNIYYKNSFVNVFTEVDKDTYINRYNEGVNISEQNDQTSLDGMTIAILSLYLSRSLRSSLWPNNFVGFVADGSILPRSGGGSNGGSPLGKAKAFDSGPMGREVTVQMFAGEALSGEENTEYSGETERKYSDDCMEDCETTNFSLLGLVTAFITFLQSQHNLRIRVGTNEDDEGKGTDISIAMNPSFTIRGLPIPKGITLITGGAFHGKSTLLRSLASGVYDKVISDGRLGVVTLEDTVGIRSEDGRMINNLDISLFFSHLPASSTLTPHDFTTSMASGSTSQAGNICEGIEWGAKLMLLDEDTCASNFMSLDGRIRALLPVKTSATLTPYLYRVNGIYDSKDISAVVVVGGVGEYLDVGDFVIGVDDYDVHDWTEKAKSISRQFAHGRVEYAGRGTAHRLPYEEDEHTGEGSWVERERTVEGRRFVVSERGEALSANSSHLLHPRSLEKCEMTFASSEIEAGALHLAEIVLSAARGEFPFYIREELARGVYQKKTYVDFVRFVYENCDWCWTGGTSNATGDSEAKGDNYGGDQQQASERNRIEPIQKPRLYEVLSVLVRCGIKMVPVMRPERVLSLKDVEVIKKREAGDDLMKLWANRRKK